MPDPFELAGLEIHAPPALVLGVGLLLIVFGRRLYWVLVALGGFALGSLLFLRFADAEPGVVPLVLGALAGAICAAAAVLFQKLAVAAAGFLAAGLAMLHLGTSLGWEPGYWVWIAALAAGLAGALLARSLFELALVVATSIAGAALVTISLAAGPAVETPLFLGLAGLGVVLQLAIGRKGRRSD